MSFVYEDKIYITCSGSCFGNLTVDSFSVTDMKGNHISGPKPSKELPLHVMMYTKTGSEELFAQFKSRVSAEDGYLLAHHGPVVGGKSILNALYALEELEESAQMAWELRNVDGIEKI